MPEAKSLTKEQILTFWVKFKHRLLDFVNLNEMLPKLSGIGSIHLEFKRCGNTSCRCYRGLLHGPYAYHHWREHGRQKKVYVPMKSLTVALERVEHEREQTYKIGEVWKLFEGN